MNPDGQGAQSDSDGRASPSAGDPSILTAHVDAPAFLWLRAARGRSVGLTVRTGDLVCPLGPNSRGETTRFETLRGGSTARGAAP